MYHQDYVLPVEMRGASSVAGTAKLRMQLPALFAQYQIRSMFDAGANDAAWQYPTLSPFVNYYAGERNEFLVETAKKKFPLLNIVKHDVTVDALPAVDVLFVRDVAIHFNNQHRKKMFRNWLDSSIPWLLITQTDSVAENIDQDQTIPGRSIAVPKDWYFSPVNWRLPPWNFPEPTAQITDEFEEKFDNKPVERFMSLWHQSQIRGLL